MRKLALSLVVLAGCSNAPVESPPVLSTTEAQPASTSTSAVPETSTSSLSALGATTLPAPSQTIPESPRTTITQPRPAQREVSSPTTTILADTSYAALRQCIGWYESRNGDADPNIYQFIPSTWRAYGGTGRPEDASVAEQNRIFDLAWADGGPHHWAAQKGRCF
jgi:hypothetical protein